MALISNQEELPRGKNGATKKKKNPEKLMRLREGGALCERARMGQIEAMGGDALTVQLIGKRGPVDL